jgi:hypothetical protein
MKTAVLLVVAGALGGALLATVALLMQQREGQAARLSAEPDPRGGPDGLNSTQDPSRLEAQMAALQTRLDSIEAELRELRGVGRREATAPVSDAQANLTSEQFVQLYRQPVLELIDEARLEQAWRVRQGELANCADALVRNQKLSPESFAELKEFLIRESRAHFEVVSKLNDPILDEKSRPEIEEQLRTARRTLYSSLHAHFLRSSPIGHS